MHEDGQLPATASVTATTGLQMIASFPPAKLVPNLSTRAFTETRLGLQLLFPAETPPVREPEGRLHGCNAAAPLRPTRLFLD